MWWIFPVLGIFFVLFLPVSAKISSNGGAEADVRLEILGLCVYKTRLAVRIENGITVYKLSRRGEKRLFSVPDKNAKLPPEFITQALEVKKLDVRVRIGTGDAFYTALICGTVGAAFGGIRTRLGKKAVLCVYTEFEGSVIKIYADCIIGVKIADIIINYLKKGGKNNEPDRKHITDNDG